MTGDGVATAVGVGTVVGVGNGCVTDAITTIVSSFTKLFAALTSSSVEFVIAVLLMRPVTIGSTTIVTVAVPPKDRFPILQATTPFASRQAP